MSSFFIVLMFYLSENTLPHSYSSVLNVWLNARATQRHTYAMSRMYAVIMGRLSGNIQFSASVKRYRCMRYDSRQSPPMSIIALLHSLFSYIRRKYRALQSFQM